MRSGRHISSQLPGSDPPRAPFDSSLGLLVHDENTHPERAKVKRRAIQTSPETGDRHVVSIWDIS